MNMDQIEENQYFSKLPLLGPLWLASLPEIERVFKINIDVYEFENDSPWSMKTAYFYFTFDSAIPT